MGLYLNTTNDLFAEAVSSEIYVDKTDLKMIMMHRTSIWIFYVIG